MNAPPARPGGRLPVDGTCWPGRSGRPLEGGGPCLDNWKAFILACISEDSPLALAGGGGGLRAALTVPRGLEEAVIGGATESTIGLSDGGFGDVDSCAGALELGDAGSDWGGLVSRLMLSGLSSIDLLATSAISSSK